MEIDRRDNTNGHMLTVTFNISKVSSERFSFLYLAQTGRNHCGDDRLVITSLRIFGTLSINKHKSSFFRVCPFGRRFDVFFSMKLCRIHS